MDDPVSTSQTLPRRSCAACKRRKIKCDRGQPCSYCSRLKITCVYPEPPDGEGKTQAKDDIVSRLERIESSLRRLESNIENTERSEQPENPILSENAGHIPQRTTADQGHGKLLLTDTDSRFVTSNFWANLDEQARGVVSESTCHIPDPGSVPSNHRADETRGCFVFGLSSANVYLRPLHPPANRIFALWQVYLESVDPLLKLIHVPITQRQILRAVQNLDDVPVSFQSLMFAIYHAAVTSMEYSVSPHTLPPAERKALLAQYAHGVEQALSKANFMSSPDVVTLQALTLYLICARQSADKSYIWSMTGLLVRLATKLGLHQDPARLGLSAFVCEMRRRLWWQICILDIRTAEDNDLEPCICEHSFDTKFPANVNDVDLHVNMTSPATELPRPTEMMYTLSRMEISYAARRLVFSPRFCIDNGYPLLSLPEKEKLLQTTLATLQEKYLQYCDATIPICSLTTTSTRAVLEKIKLTISHPSISGEPLSEVLLNDLVTCSIEIIEYAGTLRSNAEYAKWIWLFQRYIEWDAVAFLLHSLGAVVLPVGTGERAWRAVDMFWAWQGDGIDGERWLRLQRLRNKAEEKQGLGRVDTMDRVSDHSALGDFEQTPTTHVQTQPPVTAAVPTQQQSDPAELWNDPFDTPIDLETPVTDGAHNIFPVSTADQVDWSFDTSTYAAQGVPTWDMDMDSRAFSSCL